MPMSSVEEPGRSRGQKPTGLIRRYPASAFFAITFIVSWAAALGVAWPWIRRGQSLPNLAGILMFPAMLLGPSVTGVLMTRVVAGPAGLRALADRLGRWSLGKWYATLLIPPVLVYGTLASLQHLASAAFAPNLFFWGVLFGVPAGYLEEIGWMGFAYDRLRKQSSALGAAVVLGVLWAAWHLPVVDFLGAAHPHGSYWLPFFLAFATAMIAMRVLISWVYVNSGSILATQLLHMTSTGALVVFSAPRIGPGQEAAWYGLYALALWLVVAAVVQVYGPALERPQPSPGVALGQGRHR